MRRPVRRAKRAAGLKHHKAGDVCALLSRHTAQISGVVFDSLVFGHRELVRWGQLAEGDIRDGAALDAVFSAYRFDAVMHFAALAYAAPGRYYDPPR